MQSKFKQNCFLRVTDVDSMIFILNTLFCDYIKGEKIALFSNKGILQIIDTFCEVFV